MAKISIIVLECMYGLKRAENRQEAFLTSKDAKHKKDLCAFFCDDNALFQLN
jgi:hypothetical protein